MQGQINIKQLLKRCAFLAFAGSLTACFDEQTQTLEAGQNTARAGSILFTQVRDQKMRIKLGSFIFSLPDNWRDTSSYTYKSEQQKQVLTVSFGKTREATTLDAFVAKRRQELSSTMGDKVKFLLQKQVKFATLPAIFQSFSFGDQSNRYLEQWVTAYYADNKYLTLSYVGPQDDKTLQATFEQILASGQTSTTPQPEQITDHYIWRQAQMLRLQIPDYLKPPRHYTYVSADGSFKLKASWYGTGDSWPDTSIEDDAAKSLRFGGEIGASNIEYLHNLAIEQVASVFQGGDPIEPVLYRAHRTQITGFGGRLILYIKANASKTREIDAFWLQFMSDLIADNTMIAKPKVD
jgi:hypothetical protein